MRDTSKDLNINVAIAVAVMAFASLTAILLSPHRVVEPTAELLVKSIPPTFDSWQELKDGNQQVSLFAVDENGKNPMNEVYDDSLLRTYVDPRGERMMLAIAYDRVQREEDRVHRPEICYIAQGFSILADRAYTFDFTAGYPAIQGRRMLTRHGNRIEAVSYWIRTGESFSQNPWNSRIYVIAEGLAGRLHDGILVRTSEIIRSPSEAPESFTRQEAFLQSLLSGVDGNTGALLAAERKASKSL